MLGGRLTPAQCPWMLAVPGTFQLQLPRQVTGHSVLNKVASPQGKLFRLLLAQSDFEPLLSEAKLVEKVMSPTVSVIDLTPLRLSLSGPCAANLRNTKNL